MQLWGQYSLFLLKSLTLGITILIVVGGIIALLSRGKIKPELAINKLNTYFDEMQETLNATILSKKELKALKREKKHKDKKNDIATIRKRIFVVDFEGDIKASAVDSLREEITAILMVASPKDEVVVRLESPGGMVAPYGLGASQLLRLKEHQIPLTVLVDKVAASGGYLMACVANKILAAPFAIIGSIGVVVQLPNFNRFLKKHDVDIELITAGKHKRTLTMLGENTAAGREKFKEELMEIHDQFKDIITENRMYVDIEKIATGEHWLARKALALQLIDGLMTSDDYLLEVSKGADIYHVNYSKKKKLSEKMLSFLHKTAGFKYFI